MSTEPLTSKQYSATLGSIRSDAKKLREIIDRMATDEAKLREGGHLASADVLHDSLVVFNVALGHMRDVFKADF